VRACEGRDKPSGSIICGELFDLRRTRYLLRNDSAPWRHFVSNNYLREVNTLYAVLQQ
jgi:hypothetical protein